MKLYRHRLLSTTYMTLAIGSGALVLGAALPGTDAGFGTGVAYAACQPCNPCAAAANPCNPCAADPCNPCAVKIQNPCNPCAATNPCNPCAAANPCNPCQAQQ